MLSLPRELVLHEINRYLVEIDRQILRRVCSLFSSLFPYKKIEFDDYNLIVELAHICRYQKLWTIDTMNKVVKKGDLESLKYLHSPPDGKSCQWDSFTTLYAAQNGHLECLKYLHRNYCDFHTMVPAYAALNGHLECLKYAHENGYKLHLLTTSYAAQNGHLECLRYAHENGCEWDIYTIVVAAFGGTKNHLKCLEYAREHGCPEPIGLGI